MFYDMPKPLYPVACGYAFCTFIQLVSWVEAREFGPPVDEERARGQHAQGAGPRRNGNLCVGRRCARQALQYAAYQIFALESGGACGAVTPVCLKSEKPSSLLKVPPQIRRQFGRFSSCTEYSTLITHYPRAAVLTVQHSTPAYTCMHCCIAQSHAPAYT